jgi:hypothetical protein
MLSKCGEIWLVNLDPTVNFYILLIGKQMSNYREELAKAKIQELIRQGKNPDHHFDDDIHWYKHKDDPYIPPSEDDRERWGKEEEKTNKQKTF